MCASSVDEERRRRRIEAAAEFVRVHCYPQPDDETSDSGDDGGECTLSRLPSPSPAWQRPYIGVVGQQAHRPGSHLPSVVGEHGTQVIPLLDRRIIEELNTDQDVLHIPCPHGLGDIVVRIANRVYTTYLYNRMTGKEYPIPINTLRRRGYRMGYQHAENKFSRFAIRFAPPTECTLSLFHSNKMVETGAVNERVAKIMSDFAIEKILEPIGMPHVYAHRRECNNIVASGIMPYGVCLRLLARRYPCVTHEDIFAGAVIRHEDLVSYSRDEASLKITMLVFPQGKTICIGAKSIESLIEAHKIIQSMLYECRATPENLRIEEELLTMHQQARAARRHG